MVPYYGVTDMAANYPRARGASASPEGVLYSVFLAALVHPNSLPFCLAVLHPVLAITARHLATTLPPPSDLHTGIFVPCHRRESRPEFPSSTTSAFLNP